MRRLTALLEERGRDRSGFGVAVLDHLAALGVDRVAFRTIGQGLDSPAAHLEAVEEFAAVVADKQGLAPGEPLTWRVERKQAWRPMALMRGNQ
ncbi:hypothetical protein [Streptomyces sp. NPDC051219]|uniref:hypothetical protein n=1 Tax=Streptomyces sp. NPDC051219 TaxID=3155283 RepID=UPI0034176972